jgi:hypothetical protein
MGPNWLSNRKTCAMTIRERFCDEAPEAGLVAVLGEPTVLDEGEARTSFEAPPLVFDGAPPGAVEDASCGAGWVTLVLGREDSSWLAGSCCPGAAKGADEVEDVADDLRLPTRRDDADGSEGKLDAAGE